MSEEKNLEEIHKLIPRLNELTNELNSSISEENKVKIVSNINLIVSQVLKLIDAMKDHLEPGEYKKMISGYRDLREQVNRIE